MSGLPSLAIDFAEAAHSIKESGAEILHIMAAHAITDILGLTAGVFILDKIREHKTKKALIEGNFENDHAVFGDTIFSPSGEINPETGREYIDQTINTFDGNIELEKVFPPPHNVTLMKYIMEATKHCSYDNPVVFSHLDKVIHDPVHLEKTKQTIAQCWVNHFSTLLGGNLHRALVPHGERQIPVHDKFVPVLTMEKDAVIKKFRIFLVREDQLDISRLPDPEDLRVEVNNEFVVAPNHHYMQRLDTYKSIGQVLSSDEGSWIKDYTTVRNPVAGKFRNVPRPVFPESAPT